MCVCRHNHKRRRKVVPYTPPRRNRQRVVVVGGYAVRILRANYGILPVLWYIMVVGYYTQSFDCGKYDCTQHKTREAVFYSLSLSLSVSIGRRRNRANEIRVKYKTRVRYIVMTYRVIRLSRVQQLFRNEFDFRLLFFFSNRRLSFIFQRFYFQNLYPPTPN